MKQYPDYHSVPRFEANPTQRETTQKNFARKLARRPPRHRPIMCTVRIPQQLPGEGGVSMAEKALFALWKARHATGVDR